jgi:hypothetical protein
LTSREVSASLDRTSVSAGNLTLTLTATAKDPRAAGYYAGFDYLLLRPAG